MKNLRKGLTVSVIAGKDKGKQGEIIEISHKLGKIKVKDVNLVTHFVKPRKQGEKGGIVKREAYIHVSNVLPLHPATGKPVRHAKLPKS